MAVLGASGLASAAALLWLASNRIPGIAPDIAAALLLAIQWHLVGLTLAKFGIDYAVFAIVSRNPAVSFRVRDALAFPVVPLTLSFAAASAVLLPPVPAALVASAVFFDTLSTVQSAELNARRRFAESAFGNLLNYPVFVLAWAAFASAGSTTLVEGLGLFLATRVLRYAWVAWRASRGLSAATGFEISVKGWVGLQGALNLLVFRFDQVLLAILFFAGAGWLEANPGMGVFLFLSRFPEFATGILVLAGTVLFPKRYLMPGSFSAAVPVVRLYLALGLAVGLAGAAALALGGTLYAGSTPDARWWLPFAVQIALILPANLVTYSMQSGGYLPGLLRNYGLGIAAGALVAAVAVSQQSLVALAWAVPAQLAVFLAASLAVPWGREIRMFETSP